MFCVFTNVIFTATICAAYASTLHFTITRSFRTGICFATTCLIYHDKSVILLVLKGWYKILENYASETISSISLQDFWTSSACCNNRLESASISKATFRIWIRSCSLFKVFLIFTKFSLLI